MTRAPGPKAPSGRSEVEQIRAQARLRVGDPQVRGALVRRGEQPTDASGDGVLGERRDGELAELLERRLLVREAQLTRLAQVLRQLVAQDLERPLDARP